MLFQLLFSYQGNIESRSDEIEQMVGDTNIFLSLDDDTGKNKLILRPIEIAYQYFNLHLKKTGKKKTHLKNILIYFDIIFIQSFLERGGELLKLQ
jgi:hypothetical protein